MKRFMMVAALFGVLVLAGTATSQAYPYRYVRPVPRVAARVALPPYGPRVWAGPRYYGPRAYYGPYRPYYGYRAWGPGFYGGGFYGGGFGPGFYGPRVGFGIY